MDALDRLARPGGDLLDRLAPPGTDLLSRVDDLLTTVGAPADHRVWPLVRRLRALPGEATAAVAALEPESFATAGTALRELLPEYAAIGANLVAEVDWAGAAAAVFDAHRGALASHLDQGGPESLRGRLVATAAYAEDVADWLTGVRAELARTLAEVLGSAEAVAVVTGPPPLAETAAAEIGARVLATVADGYDEAEALLARWRPALAELPYRPPVEDLAAMETNLRVGR